MIFFAYHAEISIHLLFRRKFYAMCLNIKANIRIYNVSVGLSPKGKYTSKAFFNLLINYDLAFSTLSYLILDL